VDHRAFVERSFGLEVRTFREIGGWDCVTYDVNGEWIFQFPRLPGADEALRAQVRLLPELAPEVSAAVPVPAHVSDDPLCMGYRRIDGEPLDVERAQRGILPERLGRFLFELQLFPVEFAGMRLTTPAAWRERCRRELATFHDRVTPMLEPAERDRARAMFGVFLEDDANFRFAPGLIHRDLGPGHILMTPSGDLAGVIDWGDATTGDPAADFWFVSEWPELGERALAAFGGEPDPTFRDRARFYRALGPWHEVTYGLDTGQPGFVESGLAGVRRRLT